MSYTSHYIPLESNPEVFTELIHELGVSRLLMFIDIWSIDDPEQVALIPRPVLALILVFPTTEAYEEQKDKQVTDDGILVNSGDSEGIVWFKQTVNNACGLYAILHAIANSMANNFIDPSSVLANLLESCRTLKPDERALVIEHSKELKQAYTKAALRGSSQAPNAEDEVEGHFVCFVKQSNGDILQLDGDLSGPVIRGQRLSPDADILSEHGLTVIRDFIKESNFGSSAFSLLGLVPIEDRDMDEG